MEYYNRDLHMPYLKVSFWITLSDLEWLSEGVNDMKHRATYLRQLSFLLLRYSCIFRDKRNT